MKRFKKKLKKYNNQLYNLYLKFISNEVSDDYYEFRVAYLHLKLFDLITFYCSKNIIDFDDCNYLITSYDKLFRMLGLEKYKFQVCLLMGSIEDYINAEID